MGVVAGRLWHRLRLTSVGQKAILKTGIFVETKAVHHYAELLNAAEWDDPTRRVIEKDQPTKTATYKHGPAC